MGRTTGGSGGGGGRSSLTLVVAIALDSFPSVALMA